MNRTSVLRLIGGFGALASAFGLYSILQLIRLGAPVVPGGSPVFSWASGGFFTVSILIGLFLLFRKGPPGDRPTR